MIVANNRLTAEAKEDLRRIYVYRYKESGEQQADEIYYRINQDWIDIMAILDSQDMDVWL